MPDLDFELRLQLLRVQPSLSLAQADDLVADLAISCLDIQADNAACGVPPADFITFTHIRGAALIAIYRLASVEFFALAADESLIHDTEHIAMSDVPEFLAFARSRFGLPEAGLGVSASEASSWMETHRQTPVA